MTEQRLTDEELAELSAWPDGVWRTGESKAEILVADLVHCRQQLEDVAMLRGQAESARALAQGQRDQALEQVTVLREALGFYADEGNHDPSGRWDTTAVERDNGVLARAALARTGIRPSPNEGE